MRAWDRAVSMIVLGSIAPIALMLLGWWGTLGGFVVGRRHGGDRIRTLSAERDAGIAAVVSAGTLFVLCCVTAWLALTEPTITSQVQHMVGLPFEPTIGLLRVVTLIGGLSLVAAEYFATLATAEWARRAGSVRTTEDRR